MSNTVTLQGNPVSVSGHFPVAGEQAMPFSLVAAICPMRPWRPSPESARS